MFITHSEFKYPFPEGLIPEDEHYWIAVSLATETSWFLVRIFITGSFAGQDRLEKMSTVMVTDVGEVERLAKQDLSKMPRFESVQVVTPGHLNGTGAWKMDQLKALWTADDPLNPDEKVQICEILSGAKYIVSICSSSIEELLNQKLRYEFPAVKTKA